jgi:hypothetical protein
MSGIIHSRRIFTSTPSTSGGGGGGTTINIVPNYGELPDPTTVSGQFYWCSDPINTHLTGLYYSDGINWEYSQADDITVVANYSALPAASSVTGQFYWCSASQGTAWLPGSLGGTYYSAGLYYSNGSTWEYLDVPYQATQLEVDTGTVTDKFVTPSTLYNATRDFIQFDIAAPGTPGAGKVAYNGTTGALAYLMNSSAVECNIGQTMHAYVHNADSVTITKGQVVYLFSASGNKASVKLANNTSDATSAKTFGLAAENITSGQNGFIICQGVIDGLNLGSYTDGDSLYLANTNGSYTNVKPYAPEHLVYVGIVERANNGNGQIYVKVQNGYEMDELHNVQAQSPLDNSILMYDTADSQWKAQLIPTSITIACSDETTALTTGTAKVTFRMPYAMTLSAVRASLTTAQASGNIFTVDINESGTSILSTKLTIDNTELTSTTAATPPVISDSSLADDSSITVDIDQIGTSGATGLKVTLIGTRVS